VDIRGTGFDSGRRLVSHLRRPDGSEYGVIWLLTDARGEFLHSIDTLLLLPGTHELWVEDEESRLTSNIVRFTIGFDQGVAGTPEAQGAIAPFTGTWEGGGVLISLTGETSGSVGGTIAYPFLSCGAILTFRALYADAVEFFETSTFGTERCPVNTIVNVKLLPGGDMILNWRHPAIAGTAAVKLTSMR
jgi:hypothetical protein